MLAEAQEELLAVLTVEGRWRGGCRSRLLESGLVLHLLRRLGESGAALRKLTRYCEAELAASAPPEQGRLERELSRLIAASALGQDVPTGQAERVLDLLGGLDHHSRGRKQDFLLALLQELAPRGPWPQVCLPEPSPGAHRWIKLITTALRLLAPDGGDRAAMARELTEAQGPDGGWERHLPATVTVLLALSAYDADSLAVRRGVRFLLAQQRADGGFPFISDEDTWVTGLTALTLAESGIQSGRLERAAEYLLSQQLADGGWGYAQTVSQADADDTSVITLFLTGFPGAAGAAERGARHLLELQNDDGGFPTFARGAPSEVEITAKCIRTLAAFPGDAAALAVERGWRWLSTRQRPDGGFDGEWSRSPAFPVLHVVRAVTAAGERPGLSVAAVREGCANFLRRSVSADSGWRYTPQDTDVSLLTTAHAVAALGELPVPYADLIASALPWLVEPGAASTDPDSLGPRPFVYDVPILSQVYRLAALSATNRVRPPLKAVLLPLGHHLEQTWLSPALQVPFPS